MNSKKTTRIGQIGQADVERVAKLARLEIPKKDIRSFTESFADTLAWVSKLQKVDVADVDETSQITRLVNVVRPDQPRPSMDREVFLKDAPAYEANQLKVRAIFG